MIQFPRDFLFGAATSAYQVEGNNSNCDWWQWEKESGKVLSGQACRHYELYNQDFDLAKSLNHNSHRISIEWSRVEPEEGRFQTEEIDHYKRVILSLRARNLEPIVTLHHFTNPIWLAKLGGWENKKAQEYFLRFTKIVIEAMGENVRYWLTINEPLVYVYHAYLLGVWPPQQKSFFKAKRVTDNMSAAHIKAYRLIHDHYRHKSLPVPYVSVAQNLLAFVYCKPTLKNKVAVALRNKVYNFSFIEKLKNHGTLDFIGINYYNRGLVDVKKWAFPNLLLDNCLDNCLPLKKNSLGWDIYPEGLYRLLSSLKKYNLPILITENGICTQDDTQRWDYIREHLKNIQLAINSGVKVIGYIYWSLLDNFEWDKGFVPRFGLVEMDYNNFQRMPRESANKFALVCKTGRMET